MIFGYSTLSKEIWLIKTTRNQWIMPVVSDLKVEFNFQIGHVC